VWCCSRLWVAGPQANRDSVSNLPLGSESLVTSRPLMPKRRCLVLQGRKNCAQFLLCYDSLTCAEKIATRNVSFSSQHSGERGLARDAMDASSSSLASRQRIKPVKAEPRDSPRSFVLLSWSATNSEACQRTTMNCITIPRAGLLFSLWKKQVCIILEDWIHALAPQTSTINVVPSTSIEANKPLDAARTLPPLFLRHLKALSYPLLSRALVSIGKCMFWDYHVVSDQILSVVDEDASQIQSVSRVASPICCALIHFGPMLERGPHACWSIQPAQDNSFFFRS